MRSNVDDVLKRNQNPEKRANDFIRELTLDLGTVKSELTAVTADEHRSRRQLDELKTEMNKMEKYAVKSLEYGKEDEARVFLRKKSDIERKAEIVQQQYRDKLEKTEKLKQIYEKLASDILDVASRFSNLKGDDMIAKTKGKMSELKQIEDDVLRAIYEAEALAELRKGPNNGELVDEYFDTIGAKGKESSEDELSRLKKRMNKE